MASYVLGQVVRQEVTFTNTSGALVDPSNVKFSYRHEKGDVTSFTYPTDSQVVRDSLGKYHVDVTGDKAGGWFFRWEGLGANKGAGEGSFNVLSSRFL